VGGRDFLVRDVILSVLCVVFLSMSIVFFLVWV